MNVADSVSSSLEKLGYAATEQPEDADVIVLNTCVVRQSAEDKAIGRLTSLRPLKDQNPGLVINLMGCLVGVRGAEKAGASVCGCVRRPPIRSVGVLLSQGRSTIESDETTRRFAVMDGELILPEHDRGRLVSAHVPIVYGC
jgi:tRNA-2-methylthio-N6-dimethylallyladenosine synthase